MQFAGYVYGVRTKSSTIFAMSLLIVLRLDATLGRYKGRTSCLDIPLYNNEMMMPTTQYRNVLDIVITNSSFPQDCFPQILGSTAALYLCLPYIALVPFVRICQGPAFDMQAKMKNFCIPSIDFRHCTRCACQTRPWVSSTCQLPIL